MSHFVVFTQRSLSRPHGTAVLAVPIPEKRSRRSLQEAPQKCFHTHKEVGNGSKCWPANAGFIALKRKGVTCCEIWTRRLMPHSSESKSRQILLNTLSVGNRRIVKMQHDSLVMPPPALLITNFGQSEPFLTTQRQ
jgi:hypothetical protein